MRLSNSKALLLLQIGSFLLLERSETGRKCLVSAFTTSPITTIGRGSNILSKSDFKSSDVRVPFRHVPTMRMAQQTKTEDILDLSHYSNQRAFNLALEDIAIECSGSRKHANVDVISRAMIAEALVKKLEIAMGDGSAPFATDVITYNTLMKVWTKTAQTLADGRGRGDVNEVIHAMDDIPDELTLESGIYTAKDAAQRGLQILNDLEQRYLTGASEVAPNTFGYNIVLDGLHKCGAKDSAIQVNELFKKMRTWSAEGVDIDEDDKDSENINADASKWAQVKPDAITYSICMETLGMSRQSGALNDIDDLLTSIQDEYEKTNDEAVKPVIRVVNSAINAYLRNRTYIKDRKRNNNRDWQTAKHVHELLNASFKKYRKTGDDSYMPDITTITMVIDAYARCNDLVATEKGESLFERALKDWRESGDERLKPSSRTFTVMINAWAKTRDRRSPLKAEELLERMEALYAEDVKNGDGATSQVKPSIRTYTAAMGAWARSRDYGKPQQALKLLKKVNEMYKESGDEMIKPTLFSYNIVIDACATCQGPGEAKAIALKIAFAVNKAIVAAKLEPNHVTYSTLLKTASRLLPSGEQRNEIVKAVFGKCVKKGYVDTNVLKALEQAADRDAFYEVMGDATDRNGHVHFEELPSEWSKNVPKGRSYN